MELNAEDLQRLRTYCQGEKDDGYSNPHDWLATVSPEVVLALLDKIDKLQAFLNENHHKL